MRLIDKIKKHPAVQEVFAEYGNIEPNKTDWWIYLKQGWVNGEDPGVHSIHEQTLTDCWRVLKRVEGCSCKECLGVES